MKKLTEEEQSYHDAFINHWAKVVSSWPTWQQDTFLPLMKAADIAHKHHVSIREFLSHAAGMYRGSDPMDLPPEKRGTS